jgi:hypothetical protein
MNAKKARSAKTVKAGETVETTVQSPHSPVAAVPKVGVRREPTHPAKPKSAAPPSIPEALQKPVSLKRALKIPAILLEGDEPASPPPEWDRSKEREEARPLFVTDKRPETGDEAVPAPASALHELVQGPEEGKLPAAYGTGKLRLMARDPHWLYVHWDFTDEQQERFNGLSADRHLIVRVRPGALPGGPPAEAHTHPESRHWFMHVEHAGTEYIAELGYYAVNNQWVAVAASAPAVTPADMPDNAPAETQTARFVTVPPEIPLSKLAELRRAGMRKDVEVQEQALPRLAVISEAQNSISSITITELLRRQIEQEISGMAAAQFGFPSIAALTTEPPSFPAGQVESISSPSGGEQPKPRGFRLNVDAELVIYGATEPEALVTIGGQPIQLQPDGSFSYRFALPDGNYELPVIAVSPQGEERQAKLEFSRRTKHGDAS